MSALSFLAPAFRVLVLCLVAGGVLAKPLLVIASDAHCARHLLLSGDHGHGGHEAPVDPIDPDDAGDPWHALMHLDECCGHGAALPPDSEAATATPPDPPRLARDSIAFTPAGQLAPYRPPIHA